jgi:hypothetical protein
MAVTADDRAAALAQLEEDYQAVLDPASVHGRMPAAGALEYRRVQRDNPRYADSRAFWVSIDVDDRGYIWLGRPDRAGSFAFLVQPTRFLVLNPDGLVVGETSPPGPGHAERGYWLTVEAHPETGEYRPSLYKIVSRSPEIVY